MKASLCASAYPSGSQHPVRFDSHYFFFAVLLGVPCILLGPLANFYSGSHLPCDRWSTIMLALQRVRPNLGGMRQTQRHACRSMERVHAVFLDTRHIRHMKMFHAFKEADQHRCDVAFFPSFFLLLLSFFLIRPPCVEPRDPAMMTAFPKGCLSSAAESFRKPTGGERAREGQDTQTSHSLVPWVSTDGFSSAHDKQVA